VAICERFPALSPFAVYRERFADVLTLFADLRKEMEQKEMKKATGGSKAPPGSYMQGGTLYVPAKNDDWY
jgi:hypothetical protein